MTKAILPALVGSRICHDLISPIGAIGNGVELLELSGATRGQEIDLIRSSVETAAARLSLFRLAFGRVGQTQIVAERELDQALASLSRGGRVRIHWAPGPLVTRVEVQALILAVMCCDSAMPRGGDVAVEAEDRGWTVTARAPRIETEPRLWDYLQAPDSDTSIDPGEVHFALLAEIAEAHGWAIRVHRCDTELRLAF